MSAAPPDRKVASARLWATSKAPYLASAIFASSVRLDPGGWQRWAETVLPSRTDWRRAPAAEIRRGIALTAGTVDYSYHRPARRAHLHDDIVLPTMVRPVPEVAIVCDTSGSMHDGLARGHWPRLTGSSAAPG
ncbi:MAG: hypothetical protein ACRDLT_12935 [Solirubrobacteraceae bacterium]